MAKYVLAYSGGSGIPDDPAAREQGFAAWGAWFGQLGDAVVDPGSPTGASKTIAPGGSVSDGGSRGLNGYSVISADSLDAAIEAAKGCPLLTNGGSVDVYETIEM
jgi:hypothetical protein